MVTLIAGSLSFTLGIMGVWVRAAQDTSLPTWAMDVINLTLIFRQELLCCQKWWFVGLFEESGLMPSTFGTMLPSHGIGWFCRWNSRLICYFWRHPIALDGFLDVFWICWIFGSSDDITLHYMVFCLELGSFLGCLGGIRVGNEVHLSLLYNSVAPLDYQFLD